MISLIDFIPKPPREDAMNVVFFSGGAASYISAKRIIDKFGRDNTTLLFADTNYEDPDLYRFISDAEKVLGMQVTRIEDGRNPWQVFHDVKFLGNSRVDPCSNILKRELMDNWLKENYPDPTGVVCWVGIDKFEEHRLLGSKDGKKPGLAKRKLPYIYKSILLEKPWPMKEDMLRELKDDGIEVPNLYKLGFSHNNCGGFCIKAGKAHYRLAFETMPQRYLEWETREDAVRFHLGKDVSILTDSKPVYDESGVKVKGKYEKIPLTLKNYRERLMEAQKGNLKLDLEDEHDFRGCGCLLEGDDL